MPDVTTQKLRTRAGIGATELAVILGVLAIAIVFAVVELGRKASDELASTAVGVGNPALLANHSRLGGPGIDPQLPSATAPDAAAGGNAGGNANSNAGGNANSNAGGNANSNAGGNANSNAGGNANSNAGGNANSNAGRGGGNSNAGRGGGNSGGGGFLGGLLGWLFGW